MSIFSVVLIIEVMLLVIKLFFKVLGFLWLKILFIINDYDFLQKVLGVGINGKVLECFEKKIGGKFVLKVSIVIVRYVIWVIYVEI